MPSNTSQQPLAKADSIICFKNAQLIQDGRLVRDNLWIQNGKILNPESLFYDRREKADITIDCADMIIAPGYIDLQINGGFGYDFSSTDVDIQHSITEVARNLVKYGVTSFCPTLITQPADNYRQLLPKIRRGPVPNGATVLGAHLEGPFINVAKKGAHPVEYIQKEIISVEQLEQHYHDLSNVSILTLAPELDRSGGVIETLVRRYGLVVSLGHTDADLETSERAVRQGAKMITHLFNAMPMFHHRDPGLLGLLTIDSDKQIYYGIIADGIHTHYSALRLAYHANQPGMVLVSDAISATGLKCGIHKVCSQTIEIKDDRAYVAGTTTLCGSIATLDQCVRYLQQKVNCSVVEAIQCATLHPAEVLGMQNQIGTLAYDSDADFIILNQRLEVMATFVAGRCVFVRDPNTLGLAVVPE